MTFFKKKVSAEPESDVPSVIRDRYKIGETYRYLGEPVTVIRYLPECDGVHIRWWDGLKHIQDRLLNNVECEFLK